MASNDSSAAAIEHLAAVFRRNGYVRRQNPYRVAEEGWYRYKKGDEVRFIAKSESELNSIRQWLQDLGLKPGRPFSKGRQFAQPVYGRAVVQRLLSLLAVDEDT